MVCVIIFIILIMFIGANVQRLPEAALPEPAAQLRHVRQDRLAEDAAPPERNVEQPRLELGGFLIEV